MDIEENPKRRRGEDGVGWSPGCRGGFPLGYFNQLMHELMRRAKKTSRVFLHWARDAQSSHSSQFYFNLAFSFRVAYNTISLLCPKCVRSLLHSKRMRCSRLRQLQLSGAGQPGSLLDDGTSTMPVEHLPFGSPGIPLLRSTTTRDFSP